MIGPFFSAEQFDGVYALLQGERRIHTKHREAIRLSLEASYWICRGGAQWRFLPAEYGKRWDDLGVWGRLFAQVADDPDMQSVMIDATVIRAHACAAGAPKKTAGGRNRR